MKMLASIYRTVFFKTGSGNHLFDTKNIWSKKKQTWDKSAIPKLNEDDLEEQFVKGSGPGGQHKKHTAPILDEDDLEEKFIRGNGPGGSNVAKNSNCVCLIHKPTGIVVKCHFSRLLSQNRKLAREIMVTKLDNLLNGDESLEAQKAKIGEKKKNEKERRHKKLHELKEKWKEREGLTDEKS